MNWVTVGAVYRTRLYLPGLLIEILVLFRGGRLLCFPFVCFLGMFKGLIQFVRCPYFMSFAVTLTLLGVPGFWACIVSSFLMALLFIVDHTEYKTFRREHYYPKVETIDQGQDRQYFINTYGVILPLNFYLLFSFIFIFFSILQRPEMSIYELMFLSFL